MLTLFSFSWSLVITGKDTDSEAPKRYRGAEQWPSPQSPPTGNPRKKEYDRDRAWRQPLVQG